MADLSITDVGIGSDTKFEKALFGEAASPGDAVYLDTTVNKWKLADSDTGTPGPAGQNGVGLCLTLVEGDAEYGIVATKGTVRLVSGLTEGTTYVISNTAGGIAPDADIVTSGDYKTILGVGGTAATGTFTLDVFELQPIYTGHQIP